MKIKISYLGTPKDVQTKFGPKQKNSIKGDKMEDGTNFGGNYLSFWLSPLTGQWKVGDTVDVENVTTREYQGKTYYDIQMPKANMGNFAETAKRFEEVMNKLMKMNILIEELVEHKRRGEKTKVTGTDIDYPTAESEGLEETPF